MKALEDQLAGEETKRSILQLEARYQTRQQQRIEVLQAQRQAQQQDLQARKIQELEQERQLLATEAMLRGQDDERRPLGRDLHDGLGGILSAVKYYLGTVRASLALPEASPQLFARALHHLDGATGELRRVARDMA